MRVMQKAIGTVEGKNLLFNGENLLGLTVWPVDLCNRLAIQLDAISWRWRQTVFPSVLISFFVSTQVIKEARTASY